MKWCYTFCLGSINKKKEQKKKKGMSYEELRLPAIVAFSSGGNRSEHKKNPQKRESNRPRLSTCLSLLFV